MVSVTERLVPEKQTALSFTELVAQQLAPDIRELWTLMADNFDRDGSEAVKTYLDAEKERLEGAITSLINQSTAG